MENIGHPFDTEELHDLRRKQRRRLRLLPDWLMDAERYGRPKLPDELTRRLGDDRPLVEHGLRQLIERDVKLVQEVADRGGEAEMAMTVYGFLRGIISESPHRSNEFLHDASEPLVAQRRNTVREINEPPRLELALRRYIILAAIADDVATDGYRDPRLPGPDA